MKVKFKRKHPFYYEQEIFCKRCDGKGYEEIFKGCNLPQSDCCGGCFEDVRCSECDGNGYNIVEKSLQELIYKYKKNKNHV